MKFLELKLKGAYIIIPEKLKDGRGYFSRTWDKEKFYEKGLDTEILQCNVSHNSKKGTVRGLHYQDTPFEEVKIVRCTKGRVFEVLVDLRKNSKTFLKWEAVNLEEDDLKMVYVPKGFALGFQTLEDNTELFYQMSQIYKPDSAKGIKYDDPKINIRWPLDVTVISDKDKSLKFWS